MIFVLNNDISFLDSRVAFKIPADQPTIPGPVIFRICCSMNAYKAATGLYVSFKRSGLSVVKDITCSIEEDNRRIFLKGIFVKISRILGGVYYKFIRCTQFPDGFDSRGN